MCANDLRVMSTASHLFALAPSRVVSLTTLRLCHITSTGSGTSPINLRLNRLIMLPVNPVSSVFGTRGAMSSSPHMRLRHEDTAGRANVTTNSARCLSEARGSTSHAAHSCASDRMRDVLDEAAQGRLAPRPATGSRQDGATRHVGGAIVSRGYTNARGRHWCRSTS